MQTTINTLKSTSSARAFSVGSRSQPIFGAEVTPNSLTAGVSPPGFYRTDCEIYKREYKDNALEKKWLQNNMFGIRTKAQYQRHHLR
ncbi:MAG: hypothetical protein CSA33_00770 [Desulfobulbus propionicus]|nr:MAG: hypothetical protein CSA33_00770 [Desulfobulbus propionicus]